MLLAVAAFAADLAILLSDRAPGLFRRIGNHVDAGVARAAGAAGTTPDVRVPQSDFEVHVALWAVAMVLVGLAMWSWLSLFAASAALFATSVVVEGSQHFLTTTRNVQLSDIQGNLTGVLVGTVAVAVYGAVWQVAHRRSGAT